MNVMHWIRVLAVRGFGGVASVLATIAATRLLGINEAGLLFLALAIVTVVAGVARMGLDTPMVRFIGSYASAQDWAKVNGVFRVALRWVLISSLSAGALLWLFRAPLSVQVFSQPRLAGALAWMAWLVPAIAVYWLHGQAFVGVRRAEIATTVQNVLLPTAFAVLLWLFAMQGTPDARVAAACYLAAGVITVVVAASLWWQQAWARQGGAFDSQQLWHSAHPVWAATVANIAIQWGGQIIAGAMLLPADVAHLASAQRTALLITLVLAVTNMMLAPRFAALHHQGDRAGLQQLAQRAARVMLLVATPVALVMILAAEPVMELFGTEFRAAAPLLIILVIGQWVNAVTGSVGLLLTMTGHERDLRNIMLASAALAILLAIWLTQAYGVIGTAAAIMLASSAQNIGNLLVVKRRLGFLTLG